MNGKPQGQRMDHSLTYIVGNWEEGLKTDMKLLVRSIRRNRDYGMHLSAQERVIATLIYFVDQADSLLRELLDEVKGETVQSEVGDDLGQDVPPEPAQEAVRGDSRPDGVTKRDRPVVGK